MDRGSVFTWLESMRDLGASDLHLLPGHRPTLRLHGALKPLDADELAADDVRAMIETILTEPQRTQALERKNLDCSLSFPTDSGPVRFRVNTFRAGGVLCACFRYIPGKVPSFEWMGFPEPLARQITELRGGLVIVTGVTGSGKTTTLAAIIDLMVREGERRIITVEQPVEYVHAKSGGSLVTQREVGVDVDSFYDGLIYGLRQDPDVVLVGEIRDRETAAMAVSAAETGHLILTTLHTQDAKGAITRLVDLFPYDAQSDIRSQLSLSIRFVICQHLLPSADPGKQRVLAIEVLRATHAVRAAIRFGKIESLENAIQTGRRNGMIALDESLGSLAGAGKISMETARRFAKDPDSIGQYMSSG